MTFENFAHSIAVTSIFSFLIPLLILLLTRNELTKSGAPVLLFILFTVSGLSDVISFLLRITPEQSAVLSNSYTIVEFLLLSAVYYQMFLKEHKVVFFTSIFIFFLFEILLSNLFQPFNTFQNFIIAVESILFVLFAIGWKLNVFISTPVLRISKYPYFWINTAVLCYFAVNLFLFILTNYVFTNLVESAGRIFWSFHNFNNIIKNVLFAVGLYYFSPKFMIGNRFDPNPA